MGVGFGAEGWVLTATYEGTARVWNETTSQPISPQLKHPDPRMSALSAIVGTPDGTKVWTAGMDGVVRLWDVATGAILMELLHEGQIQALALSPNGRHVAAGGNSARIWDTATGKPVTPPLRHQGVVFGVAFNPDGRLLVTAGADHTVRLWDTATGKRIGPYLHHNSRVRLAQFSPDGESIVTLEFSLSLRTWRLRTNIEGSADQLRLWTEVLSASELDANGGVHVLSSEAWNERRRQLTALSPELLPR
jgi:WD40 repeat protein